jgi:hypothetical protein
MMRKILIASVLLIAANSASAATSFIMKVAPKAASKPAPVVILATPVTNTILETTPPEVKPEPTPELKTTVPQQNFVFFEDVNVKDIVNSEEGRGGNDNVSAVPVPAALPLMATALGIFGIARRRKTH